MEKKTSPGFEEWWGVGNARVSESVKTNRAPNASASSSRLQIGRLGLIANSIRRLIMEEINCDAPPGHGMQHRESGLIRTPIEGLMTTRSENRHFVPLLFLFARACKRRTGGPPPESLGRTHASAQSLTHCPCKQSAAEVPKLSMLCFCFVYPGIRRALW